MANSWRRCQERYGLEKRAARPILRLRQAEAELRLEALRDRGGRVLTEVGRIAEAVRRSGGLLSLADADRIVIKIVEDRSATSPMARERIALGSCWDERVAGTNGVHMGLVSGRPFTVRGRDHYYLALAPFACTSVPILDACNAVVASLTLSAIDRGREADYLFAQRLVGQAAARIHRTLFDERFRQHLVVRLEPSAGAAEEEAGLIAVTDDGTIAGASETAARLLAVGDWRELLDRRAEEVLETPLSALHAGDAAARVPGAGGRHLTARRVEGRPQPRSRHPDAARTALTRRRMPGLERLALGNPTLRRLLVRAAQMHYAGAPVHVWGETGCGKSTVVRALLAAVDPRQDVFWINGAGDAAPGSEPVLGAAITERVHAASCAEDLPLRALVIENAGELGPASQAALAALMERLERDRFEGGWPARNLRVISTSRDGLRTAKEGGAVRSDLRSHLTGTSVEIPPLGLRPDRRTILQGLIEAVATDGAVEVADEAWAILDAHGWPGNIREARDALQQAVLYAEGGRVGPLDLPDELLVATSASLPSAASDGEDEADRLREALHRAGWNVSLAARGLGIGRATINRRIRRHGLTRPT